MKGIQGILDDSKFTVLLISLSLMLFGQLFIPASLESLFRSIFSIQFVVIGLMLFVNLKGGLYSGLLLAIVLMGLEYFDESFVSKWPQIFSGTIYILTLIYVSYKVFYHIYAGTNIDTQMLLAVCSGFVMIGLLTALLFLVIELAEPNSFKMNTDPSHMYEELQYFGFITTLTVGYGDIVPQSDAAKKMAVLMALISQLYQALVVGIVIGKYLRDKKEQS